MKVTAIKGGSDWTDASVEFVVLPEGANINDLHRRYREWYKTYTAGKDQYFSFTEWLMKFAGAVEPGDDVLEVFDED